MEDYSINLNFNYFSNKILFKKVGENVLPLKSIVSREISPIVYKNTNIIQQQENDYTISDINQIKDFLKYLIKSEIGEYVYLEIGFKEIICVCEDKYKIFHYSIERLLENKVVQDFINASHYDKEIIISTLTREPLIPLNEKELIFNNLLLEEIINKIKKDIIPLINSNNLILTGEIISSNWAGQLGLVNILKKLPSKTNYNIYFDRQGYWKSLLTMRNEEKWLYKISPSIFKPDILFINSLKFEEDKKIQIEGLEKQFIISPIKYANIIKYSGENFPNTLVINNSDKNNILDIEYKEIRAYLIDQKENQVEISTINLVEYFSNDEFNINTESFIDVFIKHNSNIHIGKKIASIFKNIRNIQKVNKEKFISECVEKQLIHKGDLIGIEKGAFSNKPILAKISGRLILKYLEFGYVLIEDKSEKDDLFSLCDGVCKTSSKSDMLTIFTKYLKIPLAYQFGKNQYANFSNSSINTFSNAKYLPVFDSKELSVKEIIENNIKLIIIKKCNLLSILNYLKENPILNDFVSIGLIDDNLDNPNPIFDTVFNSNTIKAISLEEGCLKLLCDFSSKEYQNLKSILKLKVGQLTKVIKYERKNNYGNILKSLSPTEKLVKFSQVESIEKNSNLINQMFKL